MAVLAFVVALVFTSAVGSVAPASATAQDLSILGLWTRSDNGGSVLVTLHTFSNNPAERDYRATVVTPWKSADCSFETDEVVWAGVQGTWPSYTGSAWGKQPGACERIEGWQAATWDMTDPNTGVLKLLETVTLWGTKTVFIWTKSGRSVDLPPGPPAGFNLGGGVTLDFPEYLPGASHRTAKKATTSQRSAPVIPIPLNRAVSLNVQGLPKGGAVFASIDAREQSTDPTKWVPLGGGKRTAGQVALPLFSVTKPGVYALKLEVSLGGTYFAKVRAG
ncbi:MAG: hypothetical protein Q8M17_10045 [Actinomycetota bacterium]|nr:hypothetical protein [Actinomycetota bacterium]